MSGKRYKRREEFTVDEEIQFRRDGTIPEHMPEEEASALRAAGFDPSTKRPLPEVEAEEKRVKRREAELADAEERSVEDWIERLNEKAQAGPG